MVGRIVYWPMVVLEARRATSVAFGHGEGCLQ